MIRSIFQCSDVSGQTPPGKRLVIQRLEPPNVSHCAFNMQLEMDVAILHTGMNVFG